MACPPHSLSIPVQVTPLLPSSPVVGLPPGFLHLPIPSQQVPLLYCPPVTHSCFVCFPSGPGRAPRLVGRKWSLEPTLFCLPHSNVGLALFFLSAGPPWAGGSCGRWGPAGWQALHPPVHALPGVSIPEDQLWEGHVDHSASPTGVTGSKERLKKTVRPLIRGQKARVSEVEEKAEAQWAGRRFTNVESQRSREEQTDKQTDRQRGEAGRAWLEEAEPGLVLCGDERWIRYSRACRGQSFMGGSKVPPPHPKDPTHLHTAGYEVIVHFILLLHPHTPVQLNPHPHPASTPLIQEVCVCSPLPPGTPTWQREPRNHDTTAADQGLLSLTPRMLSEPHDLWTLIFSEPQSCPFLSSGLSGCLSPTPFSSSPPPLFFNLKHPSGAS